MSKASIKSDYHLSYSQHLDKLRNAWLAVNGNSLHGELKQFVLQELSTRREQVTKNQIAAYRKWNERNP